MTALRVHDIVHRQRHFPRQILQGIRLVSTAEIRAVTFILDASRYFLQDSLNLRGEAARNLDHFGRQRSLLTSYLHGGVSGGGVGDRGSREALTIGYSLADHGQGSFRKRA